MDSSNTAAHSKRMRNIGRLTSLESVALFVRYIVYCFLSTRLRSSKSASRRTYPYLAQRTPPIGFVKSIASVKSFDSMHGKTTVRLMRGGRKC